MANLTSKELTALEDQLGYEQVLVKKYRTLAEQCSDQNIRTQLEGIAAKHREHFDKLKTYLN